jgi:hypothetical protein
MAWSRAIGLSAHDDIILVIAALAKSERLEERFSDHEGNGNAMLTLLESSVRATIRQSDIEAIASEAATASISRVDATGATRPQKPAAPVDRIMAMFLQGSGESAPRRRILFNCRRQYWGGAELENGKIRAHKPIMPDILPIIPVIPAIRCLRPQQPAEPGHQRRRSAASPWSQSRGFARPASTRRGSPERSKDHSRTGRRHACSRRARYPRP